MKTAYVYKDRTGFWAVRADDTGEMIGTFYSSELEAYKIANRKGYLVR
jgi:hypothetical protein